MHTASTELDTFPTRRSSDLSDGNININLVRVKQNPKISGIELICLNDRCNSNNLRFGSGIHKISTNTYPNPFQHEVKVKLSDPRSEEHTSELQSRENLVCRL